MRFVVVMTLLLFFGVSGAYASVIDLTESDIYIRKGFNTQWLKLRLSGDNPDWLRVPGNRGNRPVRVRELGLPGVPRFRHFSLAKYPVMEFTFLSSFKLSSSELDAGNLALYLAQIGLNWQVYVNGNLIREEMYLDPDGSIIKERAVRGILMELDRHYLHEGENILAFRIVGNPIDDRTGLFMKDNYLISNYRYIQENFRNEYPALMLIAVYFFFGAIYLVLYILQRKVRYSLFYGLGAMNLAIFLFCRTKFVFDVITDTGMIQYIQFFSLFFGMSIFAAFIDSLLRQKISIFIRCYIVLSLLFCLTIPLPLRETSLRIWQIITPVSLVYLLVFNVLVLVVVKFRKYFEEVKGVFPVRVLQSAAGTLFKTVPGNILIGFSVFLACLVVDIRNSNAGIPTVYGQYGFFFMTMELAGILINQYVTTYNQLDIYSASLKLEIEKHKNSEEDLRYARNYLRNVFDSLPSMLVSLDSDGFIAQANIESERLTGLSSSSIVGHQFTDISPFNSEDVNIFLEIMSTGSPQELYRKSMFSGEEKSLRISFLPLIFEDKRGAVIRVDDITEIERKEIHLRQAQKMDAIGNLASGLAHDFNNVLSGILGMASLLKHHISDDELNIDTLSDGVETITLSVQRAAGMVRQLLDLSRRQELTLAPVDLNLSLKHVIDLCRNTLDKSIEIIETPYDGQPLIMADETQIEQALLNLCINSSHAMTIMRPEQDNQGGVLRISIGHAVRDLLFAREHPEASPEDYWMLQVSDTGVGMDSGIMDKMFDPFFTTKEKGLGTGLGLAMVSAIINQHKGFIDVHSEKGSGTIFNIYLPRHRIDGNFSGQLDKPENISKGSGIILVLDDEEVVRDITRKMLEVCGYEVVLAGNGVEGLQIFNERHREITAVILDMAMPVMSSREVYLSMKQISPEVKVLLMTGFNYDQRVRDMMALGINGFIHKPFSLSKISMKMSDILR